jgi:hypothetical protein
VPYTVLPGTEREGFNSVCKPLHQGCPSRPVWRRCGGFRRWLGPTVLTFETPAARDFDATRDPSVRTTRATLLPSPETSCLRGNADVPAPDVHCGSAFDAEMLASHTERQPAMRAMACWQKTAARRASVSRRRGRSGCLSMASPTSRSRSLRRSAGRERKVFLAVESQCATCEARARHVLEHEVAVAAKREPARRLEQRVPRRVCEPWSR